MDDSQGSACGARTVQQPRGGWSHERVRGRPNSPAGRRTGVKRGGQCPWRVGAGHTAPEPGCTPPAPPQGAEQSDRAWSGGPHLGATGLAPPGADGPGECGEPPLRVRAREGEIRWRMRRVRTPVYGGCECVAPPRLARERECGRTEGPDKGPRHAEERRGLCACLGAQAVDAAGGRKESRALPLAQPSDGPGAQWDCTHEAACRGGMYCCPPPRAVLYCARASGAMRIVGR